MTYYLSEAFASQVFVISLVIAGCMTLPSAVSVLDMVAMNRYPMTSMGSGCYITSIRLEKCEGEE